METLIPKDTDLPVSHVLDQLEKALNDRDEAVLQAPPGSGKTTLAPLALMEEAWLGHKKILMLEPRRIAARAAAARLAELMGETVGRTIGYRMRLDTRVGPATKVEVITEGILTRMLQEDPSLSEAGLVIFDEFHERSLDADLALSLCLKGRAMFRDADDPLKLLVMSATLDTERVAKLLGDAPVIRAEGRLFPVEVIYLGASRPNDRVVDRAVAAVLRALRENPESSILVFLPGQGEIARSAAQLRDALERSRIGGVRLAPLYGNLTLDEQRTAIAPVSTAGERKVVLATNIAETSLTIEGVDVVVDSGLVREPVYDPGTGMTRLYTRTVSRSSSEQRMGRAGRLGPGRCYRLWSAEQQQRLAPHATPEIMSADLTALALHLLSWGVGSPDELEWLDAPGAGPWQEALARLVELGAVQGMRLTPPGRIMANLPVHPRLARLMLAGAAIGRPEQGCLLAALLSDRNPLAAADPDIAHAVAVLNGEARCPDAQRGWLQRTRQLADRYAAQLADAPDQTSDDQLDERAAIGYLVACAWPDRIARKRHAGGYQLANGRSASLADPAFGNARWLAVAEVGGMARRKGDIIRSAVALDESLFASLLASQVVDQTVVEWDKREKRFIAERRAMVGLLVLARERLDSVPTEAKRGALAEYVRHEGLDILSWKPRARQWQARVLLLSQSAPELGLPDVSDAALTASLLEWLGPHLDSVTQLNDFARIDLMAIFSGMLTFEQRRALDTRMPERIQVPSGSLLPVDYLQSPPVLAAKLQEMFGCETTPTVDSGRVTLTVHLLSPAGRPVQVTQDLAGFWRTSYQEVKKEMKGRYPKHIWPDDPLTAVPTRRTTKR